jgi:hypothetical protein
MSVIGKKSTIEYLKRETTESANKRTVVSWVSLGFFKGCLSSIKHYGSGTKDAFIASKVTSLYDYQLFVNMRDLPNPRENDLVRDQFGNSYEIQQILIPDNFNGKTWMIQLSRQV